MCLSEGFKRVDFAFIARVVFSNTQQGVWVECIQLDKSDTNCENMVGVYTLSASRKGNARAVKFCHMLKQKYSSEDSLL